MAFRNFYLTVFFSENGYGAVTPDLYYTPRALWYILYILYYRFLSQRGSGVTADKKIEFFMRFAILSVIIIVF